MLRADANHATFSSPVLIVAMCLTAGITSCMALYTVIFGLTCGRWHSSVEAIVPYLLVQDRSTHDVASKDRTLMGSVLQDGTTAICIADASFVWVPKGDKRLFRLGMLDAQVSLTVRKREKIAIISRKCEGKTSFLCGIAGSMPKERGIKASYSLPVPCIYAWNKVWCSPARSKTLSCLDCPMTSACINAPSIAPASTISSNTSICVIRRAWVQKAL